MKWNLDDCFKERLLRKDRPDIDKARVSIKISEQKLDIGRESLEKGITDAAIVFAYASMFHAARALLFRDGIIERNHLCVIIYLKEKYVKQGRLEQGFVNTLNSLRVERHNEFYGLEVEELHPEDVRAALESAGKFLAVVKRLLR